MIKLTPDKELKVQKKTIKFGKHTIPFLVISPKDQIQNKSPVILWIHGGGYILGLKEMVYSSRAIELVKKYGVTVVSPGYRLALFSPYPCAIDDCYQVLLWINEHLKELNSDFSKIMVGGESAGGGLCAALCIKARNQGKVKIAFQMPLYPMLDNFDTPTSKNNHGKVWNTKKNHFGWKMYLRKAAKNQVSPEASPSRETDYSFLPPCYTFVGDGEPFYFETLEYVENLKKAGIEAKVDVYHTNIHAFDMLKPKLDISKLAAQNFNQNFEYALKNYLG